MDFSKNGAKDNIESAPHTCTTINSKWIRDLNVKTKNKKPHTSSRRKHKWRFPAMTQNPYAII